MVNNQSNLVADSGGGNKKKTPTVVTPSTTAKTTTPVTTASKTANKSVSVTDTGTGTKSTATTNTTTPATTAKTTTPTTTTVSLAEKKAEAQAPTVTASTSKANTSSNATTSTKSSSSTSKNTSASNTSIAEKKAEAQAPTSTTGAKKTTSSKSSSSKKISDVGNEKTSNSYSVNDMVDALTGSDFGASKSQAIKTGAATASTGSDFGANKNKAIADGKTNSTLLANINKANADGAARTGELKLKNSSNSTSSTQSAWDSFRTAGMPESWTDAYNNGTYDSMVADRNKGLNTVGSYINTNKDDWNLKFMTAGMTDAQIRAKYGDETLAKVKELNAKEVATNGQNNALGSEVDNAVNALTGTKSLGGFSGGRGDIRTVLQTPTATASSGNNPYQDFAASKGQTASTQVSKGTDNDVVTWKNGVQYINGKPTGVTNQNALSTPGVATPQTAPLNNTSITTTPATSTTATTQATNTSNLAKSVNDAQARGMKLTESLKAGTTDNSTTTNGETPLNEQPTTDGNTPNGQQPKTNGDAGSKGDNKGNNVGNGNAGKTGNGTQTTMNNGIPSQADTTSGTTPVTVTRADGSTVQGYLKDGHTYVDGGLKEGDVVPTNGGDFYYTNGRGVPTYTDANGNMIAYDSSDTETMLRVILDGWLPVTITPSQLASLPDGSTVEGIVEGYTPTDLELYKQDPQAALSQSSNGTISQDFSNTTNSIINLAGGASGGLSQDLASFESQLPSSAVVTDAGTLDLSNCTPEEVLQTVYNSITSNPVAMDDFLSWAEAWAISHETLDGSYDSETESMLNDLMMNALKTGMFGQLPYEQIRANALSSAEVEKYKAIAEYAAQLRESDADTAISKYKALLDGQQISNDDLMDFAQLYFSYLQDKEESSNESGEVYKSASALYSMASATKDPISYITSHYEDFGYTNAAEAWDAYNQYANSQNQNTNNNTNTGNGTNASGKGYDNGGYTPAQVKALQKTLGVTQDGYYGPKTRAAAGNVDIATAWSKYMNGSSNSFSDSEYQAFKSEVNRMITAGDPSLESFVNEKSIKMTDKQLADFWAMIVQNGYNIKTGQLE